MAETTVGERPDAARTRGGPSPGGRAPRRVLLVDDVPELRTAFTTILRRRFPSVEVDEAWDEASFFNEVDSHHAAIVVDRHLGRADGLALLLRVRKRVPDAGLVLMSAYADLPLNQHQLGALGIDAFVAKPWSGTVVSALFDYVFTTPPHLRRHIRAVGARWFDPELETSELRPSQVPRLVLKRCPNSHTVPHGARFCPLCGVPLISQRELRTVEREEAVALLRKRLQPHPDLLVALDRVLARTPGDG